jgi:prophage antirepressor-like protein
MTDLMQAVSSFSFNSNSFDVYLTADKTPAFLANQVCAVLDFGNPHDALSRHVDEDDLWKTEVIDLLG